MDACKRPGGRFATVKFVLSQQSIGDCLPLFK